MAAASKKKPRDEKKRKVPSLPRKGEHLQQKPVEFRDFKAIDLCLFWLGVGVWGVLVDF